MRIQSREEKAMKAVIKKFIIGTALEKPIRRILRKPQYKSASIDPIIPFLKKKFENRLPISVLEIGARYGESSEKIITQLNVKNYVIIDPYETYDDYARDSFDKILKSKGGDLILQETRFRLQALISELTFHRSFSNDKNLLEKLSEEKFDLIFIDGNHEFDYVLDDLTNFFPLVAKNGILCGDDFHARSKKNDPLGTMPDTARPSVYEAVEEFSRRIEKGYLTFGNHRGYPKTFAFEND